MQEPGVQIVSEIFALRQLSNMSDRLNSELLIRYVIINLLINEPSVDDIIRKRAGEAVSDSVFMFGNQPLSQKRPFVQGPEQHGNGNPVCEKADHPTH